MAKKKNWGDDDRVVFTIIGTIILGLGLLIYFDCRQSKYEVDCWVGKREVFHTTGNAYRATLTHSEDHVWYFNQYRKDTPWVFESDAISDPDDLVKCILIEHYKD